MIYVIKSYDEKNDVHDCLGEDMRTKKIDLIVSGDLEAEEGSYLQYCQDIIGHRVEVRELTSYVSIGHGVELK